MCQDDSLMISSRLRTGEAQRQEDEFHLACALSMAREGHEY